MTEPSDEARVRKLLHRAMLEICGPEWIDENYEVKQDDPLLNWLAAEVVRLEAERDEASRLLDMNLCPKCGPDVERVEAERDTARAELAEARADSQRRMRLLTAAQEEAQRMRQGRDTAQRQLVEIREAAEAVAYREILEREQRPDAGRKR